MGPNTSTVENLVCILTQIMDGLQIPEDTRKYSFSDVVNVTLYRHRHQYRRQNPPPHLSLQQDQQKQQQKDEPDKEYHVSVHRTPQDQNSHSKKASDSSPNVKTEPGRSVEFQIGAQSPSAVKTNKKQQMDDSDFELSIQIPQIILNSDSRQKNGSSFAQTTSIHDLYRLELPLTVDELDMVEQCYMRAAEWGDLNTIKALIDSADELKLNLNCSDALGRSALRLSIENEHLEVLELLVTVVEVDLADSLLHAINADNTTAVEILLQAERDRVKKKKDLKDILGRVQSSAFTSDITPIILAAHRDNFVILKMLLDRGDRISKPHDLRCACDHCDQSRQTDGLQHSKLRINTYRALVSPSFITLTSNDPILTAFELSHELHQLGDLENEFRSDYEELTFKCQEFATALLAETRSSKELEVVLNHDTGFRNLADHVRGLDRFDDEGQADLDSGHSQLLRLKLAIKHKQKKFVAHPHCQQLLASMWYDGLPGFRQKPFLAQLATMGIICALFPLLAIGYMFLPNSKFGGLIRKPFIKFLAHSSSYVSFLGLLQLAAVRIESYLMNTMDERMSDRGPLPSMSEIVVVVYILGLLWQEIKKVYTWSLQSYIGEMWHLLDFIMLSLYISTIAMRSVAIFRIWMYEEPRFVNRRQWDSFDPILIAECFFAGANIVSTLKLVYLFTVSPQLGPLQISLGRMLFDIFKFFCVYLLVIVAFAFGFNQLYWYYANNRARKCKDVQFTLQEGPKEVYDYCITRGTHFTNLFEIAQSLYWSTYGLIDLTSFNLEYPHAFTEFVGKLTFGVYSYIAFIVLLNMLIAMMNSSYDKILQQVDVEWKFARSKLWISYFAEGATVPVPFNLIPTPKSIYYLAKSMRNLCTKFSCSRTHVDEWESMKQQAQRRKQREARYNLVMRELTKRYIMRKLRTTESRSVCADDLQEIKGDISAFRFELLDILKDNGMDLPQVYKQRDKFKWNRKSSCQVNITQGKSINMPVRHSPRKRQTTVCPNEPRGGPMDNLAFSADDVIVLGEPGRLSNSAECLRDTRMVGNTNEETLSNLNRAGRTIWRRSEDLRRSDPEKKAKIPSGSNRKKNTSLDGALTESPKYPRFTSDQQELVRHPNNNGRVAEQVRKKKNIFFSNGEKIDTHWIKENDRRISNQSTDDVSTTTSMHLRGNSDRSRQIEQSVNMTEKPKSSMHLDVSTCENIGAERTNLSSSNRNK